ncbi:hypothetical protein EYZ11_001212 [Aspergillus tanneri]|uniref:Uncharacterized protein n=1 Tax=Aspergillus tanneri TaxID=1220188 RepID=A0A4S3JV70_9EURO|nr:uncharacterized protein ATNIH1004_011030 [Aspergillus tanneri]KAA8642089.1 hypothetical protein ATNIH1004_011030 [Aspergillus tanneri]THC99306.1 hypothetical protein EYZ11_001212 [Aspergillus tanneri]
MYELFDRLDASFANRSAQTQKQKDKKRKVFELLFGGVDGDFESRGLVPDLIWISLLYANHQGYEEVIVKATSRSSNCSQEGAL